MLLHHVYKTNVNEEEKLRNGRKVVSAIPPTLKKSSGLSKRLVVLRKLIV